MQIPGTPGVSQLWSAGKGAAVVGEYAVGGGRKTPGIFVVAASFIALMKAVLGVVWTSAAAAAAAVAVAANAAAAAATSAAVGWVIIVGTVATIVGSVAPVVAPVVRGAGAGTGAVA